jgi:hypothetical protein
MAKNEFLVLDTGKLFVIVNSGVLILGDMSPISFRIDGKFDIDFDIEVKMESQMYELSVGLGLFKSADSAAEEIHAYPAVFSSRIRGTFVLYFEHKLHVISLSDHQSTIERVDSESYLVRLRGNTR